MMPRLLRRHSAYAAFATLSLAFAVGATLVVFTIVNALWLRPAPFPDAERLVVLMGESVSVAESAIFGGVEIGEHWKVFELVAGQVATNAALAALKPRLTMDAAGSDLETLAVTSEYFRVLGQLIRGRDFTRGDNREGAEPVAIISDGLWRRAFDRRPDLIGAVLDALPFPIRIIGIAPPGFAGARRGERTDLWIPSNLVPRLSPAGDIPEDAVPTLVIARLHPGQTRAGAQQQLVDGAGDWLSRRIFERAELVPLDAVFGTPDSRTIVIREGRAATVVAGLAALVLIAGCVTLMAVVLVHYERRRRELAVRFALGASRATLSAELSRELAWIAGAGMLGALLVSVWSLGSLPALTLPGGVDLGRLNLSIDWRVLVAAFAITLLTLVFAAALPIARFTRARLAGELIGSTSTSSASSQRLRQALLTLHVGATIVVLVAAGLFVRAVVHGFGAGAGFDVDRTLFVQAQLVPPFVGDSPAVLDARDALMVSRRRSLEDGLRALPGVETMAAGRSPLGPDQVSLMLAPRTLVTGGEARNLRVAGMHGSPELIDALGVPLLAGRRLTPEDGPAKPRPVLVTASLARILWPGEDPLGQIITEGAEAPGRGRLATSEVVGVVADFAHGSMTNPPGGVLVSVTPRPGGMEAAFVVRTSRPDSMREPIRRLVQEIVPEVPRLVMATGREIVAQDLGGQRLGAWFFSGFGLVALLLGAGGVFGLVAYLAESRRREFGVRLALGATPGDLVRRGLAAGLMPVSLGVAAGLLAAALVARVFVSVLPGLSALDPLTYVSVGMLMLGCAAAAGLTAALRLRRIAPAEALRAE